MKYAYHHDIFDKVWELLEPHLPRRKGTQGVTARDNRAFLNGVFWIIHTGAPWRDLPPDYGGWKILTVDLFVGETQVFGNACLTFLFLSQILNGL